jgi:hypothetical protein
MLDTWERASTDDVLERVERTGDDARTKLRRAGALTLSEQLLPIDLAIRDWSRREPTVAKARRRVGSGPRCRLRRGRRCRTVSAW